MDWTALSTITELRSFLGLANYYHRFIKGCNKQATLLFDLLEKNRCRQAEGGCNVNSSSQIAKF